MSQPYHGACVSRHGKEGVRLAYRCQLPFPTVKGKTKVHTGFLEAFARKKDAEGRTVKKAVEEILGRTDARVQ